MIRVLDAKDFVGNSDCKKFLDKEYDSFEDFVSSIKHTYDIIEVGAVKDDPTVGYVYMADKLIYTIKANLWFEDVNIINPRKYQKYL